MPGLRLNQMTDAQLRAEYRRIYGRDAPGDTSAPARLAFREGAGEEEPGVLSRAWGGVKEAADTLSRYTPLGMGIDQGVKRYYKGHTERMAQPITQEEIQRGTAEREEHLYRGQVPGAEEIGREREPAPMPRPEPAPRPGPAPFAYPANYPSHLRKLEQTYGFRQGSLIDIQREGLFAAQGERASIRRPERGAGVPIEVSARGPEVSPEEREERWERSWGPESPVGERRAARTERFEEGRTRGRADLAQRQEQLKLMQMDPLERAVYGMQKRRAAEGKRAQAEAETTHQRALELERVKHPPKAQPAPSIRTTATEIIGIDPQTGEVQWTIPKGGLSPDEIRDINFAIKILDPINAGRFEEEDENWAKGTLKQHRERRGLTGETQTPSTATSGQIELTPPTAPAETDEGRLQRELNAAHSAGDYAEVRKIQDEARRKGYIQ